MRPRRNSVGGRADSSTSASALPSAATVGISTLLPEDGSDVTSCSNLSPSFPARPPGFSDKDAVELERDGSMQDSELVWRLAPRATSLDLVTSDAVVRPDMKHVDRGRTFSLPSAVLSQIPPGFLPLTSTSTLCSAASWIGSKASRTWPGRRRLLRSWAGWRPVVV